MLAQVRARQGANSHLHDEACASCYLVDLGGVGGRHHAGRVRRPRHSIHAMAEQALALYPVHAPVVSCLCQGSVQCNHPRVNCPLWKALVHSCMAVHKCIICPALAGTTQQDLQRMRLARHTLWRKHCCSAAHKTCTSARYAQHKLRLALCSSG